MKRESAREEENATRLWLCEEFLFERKSNLGQFLRNSIHNKAHISHSIFVLGEWRFFLPLSLSFFLLLPPLLVRFTLICKKNVEQERERRKSANEEKENDR
jgi:hypothetical protein